MNMFYTHAVINDNDNSSNDLRRFVISGLGDFDKMKVVLEQVMYLKYIETLCGESTTTKDLKKTILSMYRQLKLAIHSTDYLENSLYEIGMKAMKNLLSDSYSRRECDYEGMKAIFGKDNTQTYYGNLYTSSMTRVFFTVWYNFFFGWYDKEEFPEGIMYDSAFYYPNIATIKGSDAMGKVMDTRVVISLSPIGINRFYFANAPMTCLPCLLRNCDFGEYNIDNFIAIIANFSIDHSKYVMTTPTKKNFVDVCFDMVTGSSFLNNHAGSDYIQDLEQWIDCLRDMVLMNRLKTVLDGELFGELLSRIGENSDLVNYFKKPITVISATEAHAFRSSVFAEFLTDKFTIGLEDMDEENQDDSEDTEESSNDESDSSDETDTDSNDLDTDTSSEETSDDSAIEEQPTEEEKEVPAEKVRPQIDPGKMLLELANPTDSMSDYIYRETVSRRIASILKNPPENAMPNDLLMLKRWRSRWLYLASIACLRDFLTRVSLRISNV